MSHDLDALVRGVEERSPRVLGRAITLLEDRGIPGGPRNRDARGDAEELVRRLQPRTGRARLLGVTGPPGSGKSTLVEGLARHLRSAGETVAVLAVDPSSPFTGGALLGDRIRMQDLATDPGVFIRSMATRGALGGLAAAAHDAVDLLDAAGFDTVLVETVGVGQAEVDVVRAVDTVAVVVVPGMGDEVQTVKAGLLEIADVFVLNKADREEAERAYRDLLFLLRSAEEEGEEEGRWTPPVVCTVARSGEGIGELAEALGRHRAWLEETGGLAERRRRRFRMRVEEILQGRVLAAARSGPLEREIDEAIDGEAGSRAGAPPGGRAEGGDPYTVADRLLGELGGAHRDRTGQDRTEKETEL